MGNEDGRVKRGGPGGWDSARRKGEKERDEDGRGEDKAAGRVGGACACAGGGGCVRAPLELGQGANARARARAVVRESGILSSRGYFRGGGYGWKRG